ncbi:tellurite resistance TerB family protein [Luteimonas gilva]|uniref:Tellurite resistance TerB family protein n=1 Tax=Luteimonas gilva TaxID=2572684 RepID=A0A4U5JSD8_9GAMM|nr:tellurite resistance TerB family protein [Luteimonas gilva]TKR30947.1 tellurite resistance TerB family protein [Luteimonas gilva]
MSAQGFLDRLLKTAQQGLGSNGLDGLLGGQKPAGQTQQQSGGLLNADFGKGALAGGALGLLLGRNRTTRKLATYGGLAALGVMAYKAYNEHKQQQGQPVEPRTLDRLPPAEAELHSRAILKALVAAAKADGHIDAREKSVIEGEFSRIDEDAELRGWLSAELERPLDPAEVASAAATPEMASEMYLASVLAADDQSFMERAYLDELARQLKLDDALKAKLEEQVRTSAG